MGSPAEAAAKLAAVKRELQRSPAARRIDFNAAGGATAPMPATAAPGASFESPPQNRRPCGDCRSLFCRVCRCSDCDDGTCASCCAAVAEMTAGTASAATAPPNSDPVLSAIHALSAKMDKLTVTAASKEDLNKLKADLKAETKVMISESVDPVKDDMRELRDRVASLETARVPAGSASADHLPRDVQQMLNSLDPALRRVAFVGFPSESSAEARIKVIDDFISKYPSFQKVATGNFYTGPRSDRKLSKAGFAEFVSDDVREAFVKAVGNESATMLGSTITVKRAKTKVNNARNYSLRAACDKLKASPEARGKNIQLEWKDRVVKVDSTVAFEQKKEDLSGKFVGSFAHMRLP